MPSDRWQLLERIFVEALEHPASARRDFLDRTCGPDESMRDEVRLLLSAAERSGDFLDAPALEMFARQIIREGWTVQAGDRIASYLIERRLGGGAMGEVWRARDERLARHVAIKLLLPHVSSVERVRAFEREARSAGTLNHPNVLTVYDVGQYGSAPFLVTECLEGESLRARLGGGPLPVDAALEVAGQVARGLGAAHDRGIVHRDLKPENIFLAVDGRVKILDFGLATLLDTTPAASPSEAPSRPADLLVAGTAGYMAPEQLRGSAVDRRADIFALGVVLYEMLAGVRPFQRTSPLETVDASPWREPVDLTETNTEVSRALATIVRRCVAKSPDDRFASVAELLAALDPVIRTRNPAPPSWLAFLRQPVVIAAILLAVLALIAGGWQWRLTTSRARWARTVAAPEIQRLTNRGDFGEAFLLARQALDLVADDPHLRQLWLDVSVPAVVTTDPPGADIAFAAYRRPTRWFSLGRTPLVNVRVPRTLIRLRISKPGFQPIEGSGSPGAFPRFRLDPAGAAPAGMVRVVRGQGPAWINPIVEIDDFWIDRFEVTNREFKAFVDGGGYLKPVYWHQPFIERGRVVSWQEAVARFRDTTGRPGPATWVSGTYPAGQADFPVGGVSWYEAAAYAAFAGKSLPTIYHWYRAADLGRFADIVMVSNFGGKGPAAVGSFSGTGPFGTLDMAGNVKEWCWNETENGRFLLGGGWNEAQYMFADEDARSPFDRAPVDGLRLATYSGPLPSALTSPVRGAPAFRDVRTSKPVGDDIFAVYRNQFAYDRTPLNISLEAAEEENLWRKETVSFDAAYGGERMRAYLFLPKTASPPYQTVIFFPGADAFQLRSSRDMSLAAVDFIVRSGRAFLYPVYKGTYERGTRDDPGPNEERDLRIAWSRDLGRAIDYLDTRADIDGSRLAFYGVSTGADAGVTLTAVEPRLRAVVLQGTGLFDHVPPEIDPVNYAPRVVAPTLMLNGRYDFESPVETSQRPLFALLGSSRGQKRHAIIDSGHALSIDDVAREMLPWLDRYLGRTVR